MKKVILLIFLVLFSAYCSADEMEDAKDFGEKYGPIMRKNWLLGAKLSESDRASLMKTADFIFEGKIIKAAIIDGDVVVNAIERGSETTTHVVYFKIEKKLKGDFPNTSFSIAVHSPSISFGLGPWEHESGSDVSYRIYTKLSEEQQYLLIGREMLSGAEH